MAFDLLKGYFSLSDNVNKTSETDGVSPDLLPELSLAMSDD